MKDKMNKEQLLEQVRSGKLAIENDLTFKDNTLYELRGCLNIIFPQDKMMINGSGIFYYAMENVKGDWDDSRNTAIPTIKVREALQILKEPNMEEQIKELQRQIEVLKEQARRMHEVIVSTLIEPECPYKEGELIFVKIMGKWQLRYSNGELDINGFAFAYDDQMKDGHTTSWKFHASTNGLKLPE